MPGIDILYLDWGNEFHATARASKEQIRYILLGKVIARENKGSADYGVTGKAEDGSRWHIVFDYDENTRTARPVTAWPAKAKKGKR